MKESNSITKKSGLPPGSLIHIGEHDKEKIKISVIDYNKDSYNETVCDTIEDCFKFKDTENVSWINICGLNDINSIEKLGNHFDLHPLLLEDVLNTNHRPKQEDFESYIFITLKMIGISANKKSIVNEQISFILGNTWIISFQEKEGDVFDNLRLRLKENKGIIRKSSTCYLLYSLLDTIVDNYYFVTEHFSKKILKLEEIVLALPDRESLYKIQKSKKQLLNFRKSIIPLREALLSLQRDGNKLIHHNTKRYLSDVYEHIIFNIDAIESQREILSTIMDLYLSGISNKMNEIMKVLTIISTIFIPITFIAGIYGMNFEILPELHWKYGYLAVWIINIIIIIGMLYYFKKKKWI